MPLFIQTITFFLVIPKGMTQNIQNALHDNKQGHTDTYYFEGKTRIAPIPPPMITIISIEDHDNIANNSLSQLPVYVCNINKPPSKLLDGNNVCINLYEIIEI